MFGKTGWAINFNSHWDGIPTSTTVKTGTTKWAHFSDMVYNKFHFSIADQQLTEPKHKNVYKQFLCPIDARLGEFSYYMYLPTIYVTEMGVWQGGSLLWLPLGNGNSMTHLKYNLTS